MQLLQQITPRLKLPRIRIGFIFSLAILYMLHALLFRSVSLIHAVGGITQEEIATNTALNTTSLTLGPVQSGTDQLYVLFVANHKNKTINSVTGLGLTWNKVVSQCSAQSTSGMDVYTAFGSPVTGGPVTVTLGSTTKAIVATILRYSGADPVNPVSDAHGQNTLGINGTCTGGMDNAQPQITLTSAQENSLHLAAANIRSRTITNADPDYVQLANIVVGSAGPKTRQVTHSRYPFGPGTDTLNYTVNGTVDWVMAGLVINPLDTPITPTPTPTPTIEPTPTPTVTPTPTPTPTSEVIMVGAGDIANCANPGAWATADLLDNLPGTVFTLGDNAYPDATTDDFTNCYDPTWGRHKTRTMPAIGNHEYNISAAPYFAYFGSVAGDPAKGYYSYDMGAWHMIVINSQCSQVGGCTTGSPQETWLRADLASHPTACTLAMWHHPLFGSGTASDRSRPLWDVLYEYNADLILNGHAHVYERFAPQTPAGVLDTQQGIREIIAGTGGASHGSFATPAANSEVREAKTFGVLKLTLRDTSYDWQFIPEAGKTFTDSGTDVCH